MTQEQVHNYFKQAYTTGSDVWSHTPYQKDVLRWLRKYVQKDEIVLDVGSGRGLMDLFLVKNGYRVIGLDYIPEIVNKANEHVKKDNLQHKARFVHGSALDIPFVDASYGAVLEIGLLQHLPRSDWQTYLREVSRVMAPGGIFLNISLSKQTSKMLDYSPATAPSSYLEKYGLGYYFFSEEETQELLIGSGFEVVEQSVEHYDSRSDPGETLALLFSLARKK